MGVNKAVVILIIILFLSVNYFPKINRVKAETSNEPWFSFTIPYAYWITSNGSIEHMGNNQFPIESTIDENRLVSQQHKMYYNLTLNIDASKESYDAIVECFKIELSSDKGLVRTKLYDVGTNFNNSFSLENTFNDPPFPDLFEMKYGGGGGYRKPDWPIGHSCLFPSGGAGTGTIGGSGSSKLVTDLNEAEELFITVYRTGWITYSNNSTITTLVDNEIMDHIQLEKFGDGWLYNELVHEEDLLTIDLLNPIQSEEYGIVPEFSPFISLLIIPIAFALLLKTYRCKLKKENLI